MRPGPALHAANVKSPLLSWSIGSLASYSFIIARRNLTPALDAPIDEVEGLRVGGQNPDQARLIMPSRSPVHFVSMLGSAKGAWAVINDLRQSAHAAARRP
jgi:hypothetical protein